jgi:spermidine/putrescine transport system substrate-binding protein
MGMVLAISAAHAEGELRVYNWWDYTSPTVIERFSEAYDVDVTVDEYESNEELLATLQAGNGGYDVVVPSDYMVQRLIEEGLLAETRPNQMPNFKNVDPRWIDVFWDRGLNYGVPYLWGSTSVAVDTAVYEGDADTLKLLFEPPPELEGRIGIISAAVIEAAWRYLGKPQCSGGDQDLSSLRQLLTGARQHWRAVGHARLYDSMVRGDIALALVWNGMAGQVRREKPTWKYAYPGEGFSVWMDNVVVLKEAPNSENAKLFQNFLMDPEIAALNSEEFVQANAILGSEKFLPPDFAATPEIAIPGDGPPAARVPPLCPQAVRDQYDAIWAELTK